MSSENKKVLITGGSGDIGSAVAKSFAELGCDLLITYCTDENSANVLASRLSQDFGVRADSARLDLSDVACVSDFAASVSRSFGTPNILVNNGGCEAIGLFQDISDAGLVRIMNADLIGTMLLTKAFLPDMIRRRSGYVINISSVWGEVGASCETAYSAAKAGIIGFTKALAKECAPSGISVNCISPGFIDTKMNAQLTAQERAELVDGIPCCRAGSPQDIAEAAVFLTSGKADYICGQVLRVDGGWI